MDLRMYASASPRPTFTRSFFNACFAGRCSILLIMGTQKFSEPLRKRELHYHVTLNIIINYIYLIHNVLQDLGMI